MDPSIKGNSYNRGIIYEINSIIDSILSSMHWQKPVSQVSITSHWSLYNMGRFCLEICHWNYWLPSLTQDIYFSKIIYKHKPGIPKWCNIYAIFYWNHTFVSYYPFFFWTEPSIIVKKKIIVLMIALKMCLCAPAKTF